ncbi:MAG: PRC-barrel domain-containing protein [Opitutaceae bacterium]
MKTTRPLATTLSLLALASSFSLPTLAQDNRRIDPNLPAPVVTVVGPTGDLAGGLYVASLDATDRNLGRYTGRKLLNTQNAELGEIRDFIVHLPSSRARYAVASTGGLLGRMGNSLRLVPLEALRRGRDGHTFVVEISQAAWLQIPPVADEDYVADRFNFSDEQHRGMVQRFGSVNTPGGNPPIVVATANGAEIAVTGLVRATQLRGKNVRSSDRPVGEIEEIVLDLDRGTVAALFDSAGEFTGTSAKYLVPLSRFAFTYPGLTPITTTLVREDFARAQPSVFAPLPTAASSATPPHEAPLTPTGRPDVPSR